MQHYEDDNGISKSDSRIRPDKAWTSDRSNGKERKESPFDPNCDKVRASDIKKHEADEFENRVICGGNAKEPADKAGGEGEQSRSEAAGKELA